MLFLSSPPLKCFPLTILSSFQDTPSRKKERERQTHAERELSVRMAVYVQLFSLSFHSPRGIE